MTIASVPGEPAKASAFLGHPLPSMRRVAPLGSARSAGRAGDQKLTAAGPEDPARESALDNYANKCSASPSGSAQGSRYRRIRYVRRGFLWRWSSLARVRKCGRVSYVPGGAIGVRQTSAGVVGFAGLVSCGSIWACPVCNSRIQARRRLELGVLMATAEAQGCGFCFGALTLRHAHGDSLEHLIRCLSHCWHSVLARRSVRRQLASMGYLGYVKALEGTYGVYGWHPHIHPLFVFSGPQTASDVSRLWLLIFDAWKASAARLGLRAPSLAAQHFQPVRVGSSDDLARYLSKATADGAGVSWEMTSSQSKGARAVKGRTPWQILDSLMANGEVSDLELWREWETATRGKRALVWSQGLRDRFEISEQTDEQIADEEVGDASDTLFTVTDWSPFVAVPELGARLLEAVEADGLRGGLAFCARFGIDVEVER